MIESQDNPTRRKITVDKSQDGLPVLADARPPLFQICLGIPWGAGADVETILAMRKALLRNVNWVGFGIFRTEVPMMAQAVLLGGNVPVGLEDNLFLERAVLTSNGQLIERAVQIV